MGFPFQESHGSTVRFIGGLDSRGWNAFLLAEMLRRRGDLSGFDLWVKRGKYLLASWHTNCMYSDITKFGILEKATVDKPHNSGIGESNHVRRLLFYGGSLSFIERQHAEIARLALLKVTPACRNKFTVSQWQSSFSEIFRHDE